MSDPGSSASVRVERAGFRYGERWILRDLTCEMRPGELTALVGPSGSGKSTLIGLIVGLLRAHEGSVCHPLGLQPSGRFDRSRIGWVMQTADLAVRRSVVDNVVAPLVAAGARRRDAVVGASDALDLLDLDDLADRRANTLSGGQRQRVAVARALALGSPLIVADEPTVALDADNRARLVDALRTAARSGTIVVIATHDPEVVAHCDAAVEL